MSTRGGALAVRWSVDAYEIIDSQFVSNDAALLPAEIERLRPLVDLGGYIPCPDHRIPPDAKFENVCYYTERLHKIYS